MNSSFGDIEPTINAPMELRLLLSDPFAQYRDGTTTRVYRHMDDRVIVVTACEVKTAFLKALALVPGGVPGLPFVHRYIGCYAKDADDRSLFGECFEVEELDDPVADDVRLQQSLFVDGARALVGCDYGIDPLHDASVADGLAAADIQGTGQAFRFIAEFLRSHAAVLDALAPRHIMFTKTGRLCLADAVSFVPPPLEQVVTVFPGVGVHV